MSFGKPKDENSSTVPPISSLGQPRADAYLGKGAKIVGTLNFAGPVEIDGTVEGEIFAQDRLSLGESAAVKGKITGMEIVIKGEVSGDIVASKRLSLRRPAKIVGNISSPLISMEEGVAFDGKCIMSAAQKADATGTKENSDGKIVSFAEKAAYPPNSSP